MEQKLNKQTILVLLVVIVAFSFWAGTKYAQWRLISTPLEIVQGENTVVQEKDFQFPEPNKIKVHIAGAVKNPGVYELEEGARLEDALQLAEPTLDALIDKYLNRASILRDGEKIVVPSLEDEKELGGMTIDSSVLGSISLGQLGTDTGKININLASQKELESLTGIGPSKAQAIIEYREKYGGFKTIEELTNVSGIGEATLEKIKDKITI